MNARLVLATLALACAAAEAAPDVPHFVDETDAAVLHHGRAFADLEDIVHLVADQEDADSFGFQALDRLEHHARLGRAQRGDGLVHDQDAGVEI